MFRVTLQHVAVN